MAQISVVLPPVAALETPEQSLEGSDSILLVPDKDMAPVLVVDMEAALAIDMEAALAIDLEAALAFDLEAVLVVAMEAVLAVDLARSVPVARSANSVVQSERKGAQALVVEAAQLALYQVDISLHPSMPLSLHPVWTRKRNRRQVLQAMMW